MHFLCIFISYSINIISILLLLIYLSLFKKLINQKCCFKNRKISIEILIKGKYKNGNKYFQTSDYLVIGSSSSCMLTLSLNFLSFFNLLIISSWFRESLMPSLISINSCLSFLIHETKLCNNLFTYLEDRIWLYKLIYKLLSQFNLGFRFSLSRVPAALTVLK